MDSVYLPAAGLDRSRVSIANTLRCRLIKDGKRTNDMPSVGSYDADFNPYSYEKRYGTDTNPWEEI